MDVRIRTASLPARTVRVNPWSTLAFRPLRMVLDCLQGNEAYLHGLNAFASDLADELLINRNLTATFSSELRSLYSAISLVLLNQTNILPEFTLTCDEKNAQKSDNTYPIREILIHAIKASIRELVSFSPRPNTRKEFYMRQGNYGCLTTIAFTQESISVTYNVVREYAR